jgi:2,3-bisphosphoglycerate-independent phosphoglycerate mutase
LRDASGRFVPKTSHSLSPVSFSVLMAPEEKRRFALSGVAQPGLGNVAATIAALLGYARPAGFEPGIISATA